MDFKEIKELINTVNSSDISLFELTTKNIHVKMDKSFSRVSNDNNDEFTTKEMSFDAEEKIACTKTEEKEYTSKEVVKEISKKTEDNYTVIESPMVGTFYAAPSEGSIAFVSKGDKVNKGDVLCIIEAMKLMNEIESEYTGTIEEVLVKNGDMVEYGQPMFKIKED